MNYVHYQLGFRGGRLANQLWQAASTIGIARRMHAEPRFPSNWAYRHVFSLPDEYFFGGPLPGIDAISEAQHLDLRCRPYLQDLSFFADVADEIRGLFSPSPMAAAHVERIWREQFEHLTHPICAVHVRRGDVVTHNPPDAIQPLPASYYVDAIDSHGPVGSVVVFSDDQAWCRENIPDCDLYYEGVSRSREQDAAYQTETPMDWVDLFLMVRAAESGSIVISNSTYGWWGAFLAGGTGVAYPSRWYGSELAYIDAGLMIPDGWMKIQTV